MKPGRRSKKGPVRPPAAGQATAGGTGPATAVAVKSAPARTTAPPAGRRPKPRRRALRRPRTYIAAVCVLGAGAAGAVYFMPKGTQAHAISVPQRLPGYVLEPSMLASTGASALRDHLVASSGGEATRVVDAVYEDTAGATGKSVPQIVVFVGGHLAGSATSFIEGLTQALPGAVTVSAGPLHGQAACAPSAPGRPAECAWADNDTFGVLVSPGLTAPQLSAQLRLMRPYIEHVAR